MAFDPGFCFFLSGFPSPFYLTPFHFHFLPLPRGSLEGLDIHALVLKAWDWDPGALIGGGSGFWAWDEGMGVKGVGFYLGI